MVGNFITLNPFFTQSGISHCLTPPHTLEHNGMAEQRYHHIVEASLTLLHQAHMPLTLWSYAFSTTIYLIN